MIVSEHISDMIGISLLLSDQNWNITSHEKSLLLKSTNFSCVTQCSFARIKGGQISSKYHKKHLMIKARYTFSHESDC